MVKYIYNETKNICKYFDLLSKSFKHNQTAHERLKHLHANQNRKHNKLMSMPKVIIADRRPRKLTIGT